MSDTNPTANYLGPTTTANSAVEGRLKVSVSQKRKRKAIIRKHLRK